MEEPRDQKGQQEVLSSGKVLQSKVTEAEILSLFGMLTEANHEVAGALWSTDAPSFQVETGRAEKFRRR